MKEFSFDKKYSAISLEQISKKNYVVMSPPQIWQEDTSITTPTKEPRLKWFFPSRCFNNRIKFKS
jgi:hypothetical protein